MNIFPIVKHTNPKVCLPWTIADYEHRKIYVNIPLKYYTTDYSIPIVLGNWCGHAIRSGSE